MENIDHVEDEDALAQGFLHERAFKESIKYMMRQTFPVGEPTCVSENSDGETKLSDKMTSRKHRVAEPL